MRSGDQDWTEDHDAALRRLWTEGSLSASTIAERHGHEVGRGRSRDSILGRLRRLGLAGLRKVEKQPASLPRKSGPKPKVPDIERWSRGEEVYEPYSGNGGYGLPGFLSGFGDTSFGDE